MARNRPQALIVLFEILNKLASTQFSGTQTPFIFLVLTNSAGLRDNPFKDTWNKTGTKKPQYETLPSTLMVVKQFGDLADRGCPLINVLPNCWPSPP